MGKTVRAKLFYGYIKHTEEDDDVYKEDNEESP